MRRKGTDVEQLIASFCVGVFVTLMALWGRGRAQDRCSRRLSEAQTEMQKTMEALNQEQRQFVAMRQRWQKGQVENTYAWEYGLERETKEVKAELLAIRRN